ncbi:TadE/TadG family type IV pilus assembly protein [Sulfobacillus harzensis]|uniref:Pilus assembly protein n=1 Tax=Sulfobacillus harzensis TaxID=2729629 RepID=A0A7Y0L6W8_9FIRM|nr:TadE/TadG family type IV pilus assembly protein [Sulfobacillus harzensis]NMP24434.1 pilus assembly protein [Sulfobacillus harzensis]
MSNPKPNLLQKLFRKEGQALVEFALVAPLLLILLYGIIQFGLIFYGFITIQQAAKIGVRAASLGESASAVGQAIDNQITGIGLNPSSTSASTYAPPSPFTSTNYRLVWDGYVTTVGSTPGIVVQVDYRYPIAIPFFGTKNIEIHQSYTMAQEDPPDISFSNTSNSSPATFYGTSN